MTVSVCVRCWVGQMHTCRSVYVRYCTPTIQHIYMLMMPVATEHASGIRGGVEWMVAWVGACMTV